MYEEMLIFKSYLKESLEHQKEIEKVIKSKDLSKAEELINMMIEKTQSEIKQEEKIKMLDSWHFEWLKSNPPVEEIKLDQRIRDLGDYFVDMTFEEGSSTYEMIKCQSQSEDGRWQDDTVVLPSELKYFNYNYFRKKVESLQDNYAGYFDPKEQVLCISNKYLDEDRIILHEMIHLHEFVLNVLPSFYHDTVLWTLYTDLRKRKEIKNKLDKIISGCAHILSEQKIYNQGGSHDTLFLLKSLDLDIKMGYSLGTVGGYDLKEFLAE